MQREESRRLEGEELKRVVELLSKLEELVTIVRRRGIDFAEFLAKRDNNGRLPLYHIIVDGEEKFFHSDADRDQFLRDEKIYVDETATAESTTEADAASYQRLQKNTELHEVKEMEKLFSQLEQYGLSIDDYFLTQEESVTGEKLPTKYALAQEEKMFDVAGIAQMIPEIHKLGKQGIEVKRFKGLGEMNAEQLWETTLDPNKRVLLRVTLEEDGEAERQAQRTDGRRRWSRWRQFIEDHALEVKNLDV